MKLHDAFPELQRLYAEMPKVPCVACGLCCVSPHITLLEFAYLFEGMLASWPPERLRAYVTDPPVPEKRYPGNLQCRVQEEKGLCSLYDWRPLMCRLEGTPTLDRMGIREAQLCPYISEQDMAVQVAPEQVDRWVEAVFALNNRYYNTYEEPYWLSALTPSSWLAVALDPAITQAPVLAIRALLQEAFSFADLAPAYRDVTGLAQQLDLIDAFFAAAEGKEPRRALRTIRKILFDFPTTGCYYQDEGRKYFELMRTIVREQRQRR